MKTVFRKTLIEIGKLLPFLFAFVIAIGYTENLYALAEQAYIETTSGDVTLYTPISDFIGCVLYIDCIDVLVAFIMCVAFDLCTFAYIASTYTLLNLGVRTLLENVSLSEPIVVGICAFMAVGGFICAFNGIRILLTTKQQNKKL